MGALLAVMLLSWMLTKTVMDGRANHALAKHGVVSPRLAGRQPRTRPPEAGYGLTGHLRAAWNDYWPRRTQALIAARNARPTTPGRRVTLMDRFRAATATMTALVERARRARRGSDTPDSPDTTSGPTGPGTPPPPAARTGAPDRTGQDRSQPDKAPDSGPTGPDKTPDRAPNKAQPPSGGGPRPVTHRSTTPSQENPMTTTATATQAEIVNYQTAVAELTALADAQREHLDQCQASVSACQALKAGVDGMETTYRSAAATTAATTDQLAALNLDGTTLAAAATAADAMPPNAVAELLDHIDGVEAQATERLHAAETALAATEAALANLRSLYGDAADTVATQLSGDATFLNSDGAGSVVGGVAAVIRDDTRARAAADADATERRAATRSAQRADEAAANR